MSESDARSAPTHLLEPCAPVLLPGDVAERWRVMNEIEDQQEARRILRARRQALLMLIGSSIISLGILYGLWMLLARLV